MPAAGSSRPDRLLEVQPQERAQRHTVEQIIPAPMLDVLVPLMEEQLLVDAFAPSDTQVPDQIIEVPKILIDEHRPPRRWLTLRSWTSLSTCSTSSSSLWCFIQFINRVVVILVATQRQVCTALLCSRPLRFHSCSSWTSLSCPFCATTSFGADCAENSGIAAGAAPVVLWTSL